MADERTPTVPSVTQLDLFRAVEDIHELTGATVVLLTDREGVALAASGDEADLPAPLRAALSGRKLATAGSVSALLEPIGDELVSWSLNVSVVPVGDAHVLAIAFDAEADFETVQTVGREGARMLGDILSTASWRVS